ncbi:transcriptional regulator, IclR family [Anaerosphaera aminiphila DSM 21120]|uniref:Glycerol operon regulatory protein n=1 Tax=Anaerosphaera aminiphila DSM 21120 TaxID=1120995 RepID=A0A1M5U6F5_9FIRM|nr:IclR family transcriptional regulator [Anaerosphaera aminiphila]SHH58518.1 transcriptional regulator, IclR family [Anaerosphaera aminiphila DSM 21120]
MEERIQSVERVFKILEAFKNYPHGVGLTELSKEVSLHKSTVHRFLNTLIFLGYIGQNSENKYYLTFKLYDIASSKLEGLDFIGAARSYIEKLSNMVNEVVHLVIREDIYAVYVDKVDSDNVITMHSRIGRRSPLIYTSVGKSILSNCSDLEIKDVWDKTEKIKKTENTILDFNTFMDEINETRKTKIARDNEENELGIYCIGTSIYDSSGNVAGAISITGPVFRMKEKLGSDLNKNLLFTAEQISKQLGYIKR